MEQSTVCLAVSCNKFFCKRVGIDQRMQHQRLDRFFLGLFLYRLYGFLFVHLNQTHQQIAVLRNFLHPHRMNPGFIHMTSNFHHITILKTGDASLIFHGKHQIASVRAA